MKRLVWTALALPLVAASGAQAQSPSIAELKGKIFDARMAKQLFGNGLKFCGELDGTNFYFALRDRVLNLEDYHRSLESLAMQGVFNPETRRPWNAQDAAARWEHVKQEAIKNQADCALAASLPELEKQLEAAEKKTGAAAKKE